MADVAPRAPPASLEALSAYAWSGIVAAAASVGAAAFALVFAWAPAQRYSEFIVGFLAWAGQGKAADLWSVPVGLLAAIATAFAAHRVSCGLRECGHAGAVDAFAKQLMLWSAPAAAAVGLLFHQLATDVTLIHLSALAVLLVTGATALAARSTRIDPTTVGIAVLAVVLVALVPVEWAVLRDRLVPKGESGGRDVVAVSLWFFALGAATLLAVCARAPSRVGAFASRALIVGTMGLPVFFLLLYPAKFVLPNGEVLRYPTTVWLAIAVGTLAAWAWWDVARRMILARPLAQADPAALVAPVALFALVIGLRYGYTIVPEIPSDDFHFGEKLLGWWSLLHFHAIPFVDHIPLHGLVEDDLAGYLASLFFDGTAATVNEAQRLAYAGLAGVTYLAVLRVTGSVVLAFASAMMLGARLAWFFLAPLFCFAADASLATHPARWLGVWIVAVPIVILGVPPQGVLAVAATAPIALYAAWRWFKSGGPILRSYPSAALAGLALLALATPLGSMLFGSLIYLVEFGPINQIAYAVPWDVSFRPEYHATFANELLRMTWIAIPLVAMALIAFYPRHAPRRPRVLAVAIPVLAFSLALVPYTMGRIGPAEISRPGIIAVFGWAVLVPLMLWAAWPARSAPVLALVIALGTGMLGANPSLSRLAHAGDARGFGGDPRKAVTQGFEAMGEGRVDDAHLERVRRVRNTLDGLLPPHAPYLDLTGRHALYFYLDRKPAMPITAGYNVVPVREQRRAIERLTPDPPAIALLAADNLDFDGGTLALRAPLFFRFVLDTYRPFAHDRFVLGRVRGPDSTADVERPEAELMLLDRVFMLRDLQWVPVAWGSSADTLARKMDPIVAALDASPQSAHDLALDGALHRVTGVDPHIDYDVAAHAIAPAQAGLLKFDFRCVKPAPGKKPIPAIPRLQVFFWGDRQEGPTERQSLYFNGANGTMIVPLDAYPRYLALATLKGLRFDLDNADACAAITVRNIGVFQRHAVLDYARSHASAPPVGR